MNNYKFRGLNTKGEWIYGSLVVTTNWLKQLPKQHTKTWIIESSFGNGGWFNIMRKEYVRPETVGQFTGFFDKNGKEIYKGDTAKVPNESVGVVRYGDYTPYIGSIFSKYLLPMMTSAVAQYHNIDTTTAYKEAKRIADYIEMASPSLSHGWYVEIENKKGYGMNTFNLDMFEVVGNIHENIN